jgi:hypothetical protein
MNMKKLFLIRMYLRYIEHRLTLIEELLPDETNDLTSLYWEFLQAYGRFMLHVDKLLMKEESEE